MFARVIIFQSLVAFEVSKLQGRCFGSLVRVYAVFESNLIMSAYSI